MRRTCLLILTLIALAISGPTSHAADPPAEKPAAEKEEIRCSVCGKRHHPPVCDIEKMQPPVPRVPVDEADWYTPLKNIPCGPALLDVTFEYRVRYEQYTDFTIRGYNRDEHDGVLLSRAQLGFDWRFSKDAHAYLVFQDARGFVSDLNRDQFPLTSPHFDQADVRQAFVEWTHIGGSPVGVKIGRQAFAYGDRKLLGPSNWGNVGGFWWDAAKLMIDGDAVAVDLFFGQRVIREPIHWNERHFTFDAMGAWVKTKTLPFTLDGFYILKYEDHGGIRGETGGPGDERRHTVGVYAAGKVGKTWDWKGTLAAQFGEIGADSNRVEAYAAHARVGYTFDAPWKPRVAAEFSYASGDRDPTDGKIETFDNLFTSPTVDYGRMNLVSWQNLLDYQLTFGVKPRKCLSLWVDYHYFTLASDTDAWYWFNMRPQRRDATGRAGRELGHEIDLMARWQVSKNCDVFCGYAFFFPGAFLDRTGTADNAHWGFAQFVYKF